MTARQFNFWRKWLTLSNIMAVIAGLIVAFAGNSLLLEIHNDMTKESIFGGQDYSPEVMQLKNWLFGIIGGTIVGFHLLMIFISENAFKRKERWGYFAMWIAMTSWFLIDSSLSIYFGALHNVLLINIGSYVLIIIPLIVNRKEFKVK